MRLGDERPTRPQGALAAELLERPALLEATLQEAAKHHRFVRIHFRDDPPKDAVLFRVDSWRDALNWYDSVAVGIAWMDDAEDWELFAFHVGQIDQATLADVPPAAAAKLLGD